MIELGQHSNLPKFNIMPSLGPFVTHADEAPEHRNANGQNVGNQSRILKNTPLDTGQVHPRLLIFAFRSAWEHRNGTGQM